MAVRRYPTVTGSLANGRGASIALISVGAQPIRNVGNAW